jgi:hypothetical protein
MKKNMMQLAVTSLVLACTTAAFAAIQTNPWYVFDGTPPTNLQTVEKGIHKRAYGYVTFWTKEVTTPPSGVTLRIAGAAKSYTYVVKSQGVTLGVLRTDRQGAGSLQLNLDPLDPNQLGHTINLWTTDQTVHLFYAHNPYWPYCDLNQPLP